MAASAVGPFCRARAALRWRIHGSVPDYSAPCVHHPQVHPSEEWVLDRREIGTFLFTSQQSDHEQEDRATN